MATNNNNANLTTISSDLATSANQEMTVEQLPKELQATTQFIDDSGGVVAAPLNTLTISSDLYQTSTDNFTQDIKLFLAKPVIITSGTLASTDTVSTAGFGPFAMPTTLLSNTIISNKISGFYGLRATMVFKLIVNASRFQQGRYILAWIASGGVQNSSATLARDFHMNSITARTQLPHVEVDLACDTTGLLRVPFVSAFNHFSLQNIASSSLGSVAISPYGPLITASGPTTVGYTLYAHLEDVELIGTANPQSGISAKETKSVGKVTSAITNIKKFTDTLKNFPTISSYALPVSWVTDISLNVAKSIGWSKPPTENGTNRIVRDMAFGLCNTDVVDLSKKQSLFSNNSVGVLPGYSGTDIDELAISSIATRLAHISTFTWFDTDVSGYSLFSDGVTPISVSSTNTRTILGGVTVYDYSPLQFSARLFRYWRGSITYKIKFVKTEFHSGRLAIAFFPADTNIAGSTTSYINSNYVHRAVIDIRECNEYTITVPYISSTPYKPVIGSNSHIGSLIFYVVDPLRAPATVSSSIRVLVEHCGGSDIEFSVPSNVSMLPAYNVTPQSGSLPLNSCTLGEMTLGASSIKENTYVNGEACIGERILSFRSLLKVFVSNSFTAIPTANIFLNIIPFGVPVYYNNLTNGFPSTTGDYYTAFSAIFLLSRGGIRFKTIGLLGDTLRPVFSYNHYPDGGFSSTDYINISANTVDGTSNDVTNHLTTATTFHNTVANAFAEFEIPQYNTVHSRVNSDHAINFNVPYVTANASTATRTLCTVTNGLSSYSTTSTLVYRAMADDGDFGTFLSIGPMYTGIIRPN